jgi:signal transduction histidine kinase
VVGPHMFETPRLAGRSDGPPSTSIDLLPRIGHQLREPIGAIIGLTRIMRGRIARGPVDIGDHAGHLAMLEATAEQLLVTVERVVEAARLPATAVPSMEVFDCRDTILHVVTQFQPTAAAHGNKVDGELPEYPALIIGDPATLRRLLGELVDNAVKYGGSDVHIRVRRRVDGTSIDVVDQGSGIPSAQYDHVFLPFERGSSAVDRDVPGSGLGLYLARILAARMSATLQLASAPEHGAIFTVEFQHAQTADPYRRQRGY